MDPEEIEDGQPVNTTEDDVLAVMNELAGGAVDDQTQSDRLRDERGRYASKGGDKEPPAASAPQPAPRPAPRRGPGTQVEPPADQTQQPAPAAAAPAHMPQWWRAEEHGEFGAIPPAAQQAFMQREAAFHKFWSDAGRYRKAWEPVEQALAGRADDFKARGVQPQQYLNDVIAAEGALLKDVMDSQADGQVYLDTLDTLARRYYGKSLVDLVDMAYPADGQLPAQPTNGAPPAIEKHPLVQHLLQEVQQLKGGFTAQQQREQQAAQDAKAASQAATRKEFEAFASDKPLLKAELSAPEGAARPMIMIMQRLLVSKQAASFVDAYEQARWIHPPARDALLKEQRHSTVQRARSAAVSPRAAAPTPGAVRQGTHHQSIEDDVRKSLEELGA